jgi:pyruvate/2-oxoglutarate dehydrogenase complex dihydrolipoamide acyltransferase (E2) component
MSTEIRVPKLGMTMEEAILSEWLVADGDQVEQGSPIYSLETDKSVQEVEAPASGILRIIGTPGETYPIGELIGTLE